jgi:hypothetical protein
MPPTVLECPDDTAVRLYDLLGTRIQDSVNIQLRGDNSPGPANWTVVLQWMG